MMAWQYADLGAGAPKVATCRKCMAFFANFSIIFAEMYGLARRKSHREGGGVTRYQPLQNDSTFSRWTIAEKVELAKVMKNHHDDWRTRIGSILPGRSVAAAAGQWKTLKEEASCPVVVDAHDGVRIVAEEEAAQHVIEFLVGKESAPQHRPNRAAHKMLLHKWEEEEEEDDHSLQREEQGLGDDESGVVSGSGDDGTDDDDDSNDDDCKHRGSRQQQRRCNRRGNRECSDEEQSDSKAALGTRSRPFRARSPPESRLIQSVKLEDIEEERDAQSIPRKRMRSCSLQPAAAAADLETRGIKCEDGPDVIRKARSPRQRPSLPSCGWSRSLAIIRPAPGCLRRGKSPGPMPQQDPSAGSSRLCNTCCPDEQRGVGAALPGTRLEVTTAMSQELQASSAADDQTPCRVSHDLEHENHDREGHTNNAEATHGHGAERTGLLSQGSTRQRLSHDCPGHDDGAGREGCNDESAQLLALHDREENRARACSPSSRTSGSELPHPREFEVRPGMFLGKSEEERFKCWQWIISLSLQVLEEGEWLHFMNFMEQIQDPGKLPWPSIMWLSLSKALALVQKATGESAGCGEREILADEIRRIVRAATDSFQT